MTKKIYICIEESLVKYFDKGEIVYIFFNNSGNVCDIRFENEPHGYDIDQLSELMPFVKELTEDELMIRNIIL